MNQAWVDFKELRVLRYRRCKFLQCGTCQCAVHPLYCLVLENSHTHPNLRTVR